MRLFNMEAVAGVMDRMSYDEDQELSAGLLNRAVSNAQKKVEERNFGIRKHLLEYDDVLNQQREIIYDLRNKALLSESIKPSIQEFIYDFIDNIFDSLDINDFKHWDWQSINQNLMSYLLIDVDKSDFENVEDKNELVNNIYDIAIDYYDRKEELIPSEMLRKLEKFVVLRTIDEKWRNHLLAMDQLREGIGLRAFGQKNPLVEYKAEAYNFFQELMISLQESIIQRILHAQIKDSSDEKQTSPLNRNIQLSRPNVSGVTSDESPQNQQQNVSIPKTDSGEKIGRNEKIKVIDTNGNEIEIKFKKLESYLQRGYKRVE